VLMTCLCLILIKGVGIPSQFSDSCEELECLDDGLQLCFGKERLGKKNGN
jgi:hypothetical protein